MRKELTQELSICLLWARFKRLGLHLQMYIGKCLKIGFLKSICPLLCPSSKTVSSAQHFKEQICARRNSLFNPYCLVFSATFDFTELSTHALAGCVHLVHPSLTWSFHFLTVGDPLDSIFGPLLLFMCTFSFGFLRI